MASIVHRNNRFLVVHYEHDISGKNKQKWETYRTLADAKRRKAEIEHRQELGALDVPTCKTVNDLLKEYISLYGKATWSLSVFSSNSRLIKNYISPIIGEMDLCEISPRILEKYYQQLLKTPAVSHVTQKRGAKDSGFVQPATVRKIHSLLRSAFNQAVKWELMEKNPALHATVPKAVSKKRGVWDSEPIFLALDVCDDDRLKLAINLSFACSMRIGEILGLTWDCVDISPKSIADGTASILIEKELQRVDKTAMKSLEQKDVLFIFPQSSKRNTSMLVLKKPKTESSVRKVFIPATVVHQLESWKREQERTKEALGGEYTDYNLVLANGLGHPMERTRIAALLNALIEKNDLPKVVFHSLRHSSITYKLQLTGGDIKSVQGDSGHAQAQMVTDQYAHIMDKNRKNNAALFEEAFYRGKDPTSREASPAVSSTPSSGIDPSLLKKISDNPDLLKILSALADNLG